MSTTRHSEVFTCSVGIMAHNEAKNIRNLLEALITQELENVLIKDIVVVASGCTDNTEDIVKEFENRNDKVRLLIQKERLGKASAINYFLQNVSADIYVIESGDTLPQKTTIENLLKPFSNPIVGMTGGHCISQNKRHTFIGYATHLLWKLHHELAQKHPKLGELVAFRNVISQIPSKTVVDEATIEAIIIDKGYILCYVPDAIVYNKGPNTISKLLSQRRRIYAGHIYLKKTLGYKVSSMYTARVVKLLFKSMRFSFNNVLWTFGVALIECFGRLLGLYDFYKKKDHTIWER